MKHRKPRRIKGIALVITLFIMIILLIITLSLSSMAMTDNRIALRRMQSYKAFNLARSGLIRARAELRTNSAWGRGGISHEFDDGGKYTVNVTLEQNPDGGSYWRVTSIGEIGEFKRTVQAWLELESFSKYMYLTNRDVGNIGGRDVTIWFIGDDELDGPVHTNGFFSINNHPRFGDVLSSSNKNDPWMNHNTNTYRGGITDPSKFYHYYSSYNSDSPVGIPGDPDFTFSGNVTEAQFPQYNTDYDYWGDLKKQANVVITKDVDYIEFHPSNSGPDNPGYVIIKPHNENTVRYSTDDLTIYVEGQIGNVSGTVQGSATVASADRKNQYNQVVRESKVTIKDDIKYADKDEDMLGIISQGDVVLDKSTNQRKDVYIQASIMSETGSFYVKNYDEGRYRGILHIYGSLAQERRGPVGTFNNYGASTGYTKDYAYDPRLKFMRPPNFPHTGKYVIKAFRDKGALGGS